LKRVRSSLSFVYSPVLLLLPAAMMSDTLFYNMTNPHLSYSVYCSVSF